MKKYDNYRAALESLRRTPEQDLGNEFVVSGVISKFALQFELGWKLLKAMLAYEGDPVSVSGSPRDVIKAAFQYYDFLDESLWLRMLRDRNDSAHIYDAGRARRLVDAVVADYLPEFERVRVGLERRYGALLER